MVSLPRPRSAASLLVVVLCGIGAAVGGQGLSGATPTAEAATVPAYAKPLIIPKVLTGSNITLTAAETDVQLLPGRKTRMWTYNGTFPGPTIRRPTGQTTNVTLVNRLPTADGELTLHNHGNHSATESDGQPDDFLAAPSGGSVTYTYTGTEDGHNERGALQWYHDHRMDVTGRNVWMGLAGMYIIDDPADPKTLPTGGFDVPLMLADRKFDANNQITYRFDHNGDLGNRVLVNGGLQPYFNVGDRKYRIRILNASNARIYNLALSNGQAFTQIGTESGLLPKPVKRTQILLGPAERADVIVDFANRLNQNIVLQNLNEDGSALRNLMQFRVTRNLTETSSVPAFLRALPDLGPSVTTRTFDFGQARFGGMWTINGLGFDPNRFDAFPKVGTTETWVLRNTGGSNHFIHIHETDQQLISRNGKAPAPYELMKETWNISGNQTVVVKLKFSDNLGAFAFHCHILEHEDMSMMSQYQVVG